MTAHREPNLDVLETTRLVHGHVDRVDPLTGMVNGWCAATQAPFGPRHVSIVLNDTVVLADIACTIFRPDLLRAGIGDGQHGFSAEIPAALRVAGTQAHILVRDQASLQQVGATMTLHWPQDQPALAELEAHIDQVSEEGQISGWCWDRAAPERRVELIILADNVPVGRTVTGIYREDLRHAGKGSGRCGFSFFLPWAVISGKAETVITLLDSHTAKPVGQNAVLRRKQIMSAEQRMDTLERQIQLLRAELHAAEMRAQQAEDGRAAPDLFRLVAGFFQDLADGAPRASLASLRTRLADVAERFAPLNLHLAAEPAATILVLEHGDVAATYACLQALHRAGADSVARIIVLLQHKDGPAQDDDTILLASVVRNVQIYHPRPGETLNDVVLGTATEFTVFLGSQIHIGADWLNLLLAAFAADSELALLAGTLAIEGGATTARYLDADPAQGLRAVAAQATQQTHQVVRIDCVDEPACMLRTALVRPLGGLDASYSGPSAQILDLCLRLRRSGHAIGYVPAATAYSAHDTPSLIDKCGKLDLQRLRGQCALLGSNKDVLF